MKHFRWQFFLGFTLILLSALLYYSHFVIFRDVHHIFIYMLGDIAFVPIEVLLVTLIIHRLLNVREKRNRLEKLNMVIGTFFSEVGTKLLAYISDYDPDLRNIRNNLVVETSWSEKNFKVVSKRLKNYNYGIDIQKIDLDDFKEFVLEKREFLLRLLENPNLLEHETFTDLLRSVFHMAEELKSRENIKDLPEADLGHLANDIKRAYVSLVHEWIDYMKHLKDNYPYLFSHAMRTNPFDQNASPIVRS